MLRRLLLAASITAVLAAPAAAQVNNTWTPAGPQFSTILAFARNPSSPGELLAGAYFGGLYRSSDYGFSWTHVTTAFSSRSIFSIAWASDGTIYVGTFQGGVYRSTDHASTWTAVNSGLTDLDIQALAADPSNAQVVLAATGNGGLFRTQNGGGSWTAVGNAALRGKAIAFHPAQPGVVYLGTIGNGAYRSTDGGVTFQPFSTGMTAGNVLSLRFGAPPSRDLYAATDNGAFKLVGAATSWTNITGNLPPYPLSDLMPHPVIEHMAFAATLVGVFVVSSDTTAPANWVGWTNVPTRVLSADPTGSVIHAASIHGGLQATLDFGHSWMPANWGIQNLFIGALNVVDAGSSGPVVYAGSDFAVHRGAFNAWDTFFDQKQGVFDIQPDPSAPGTLYIGSERSGVWKSTDWGTSWIPSSTNLVPAQIYSLGQAADGKTLFAGTSSGLYLSPDNGNLWVLGNAAQLGIVLSVAADPTRAPFLFVGGANGQVLRSEDGGWSFADASHGLPSENIVSLVTAPWEKTYAITGSGALYATSDNGLNWFPAGSGVTQPAVAVAADPTKPWILYLGTSGGGVYKSESGSLTWTATNTGLTSPYVFSLAVNPSNSAVVYAGTFGGVFKSTNGGASWAASSSGLAAGSVTTVLVDAANPQVVYASVQDAGVFRSSNGGASWSPASGTMTTAGAMPLLLNQQQHTQLFAGTSLNGVYASNDSGATWQKSSFGMTLFVRGLAVDPVTTSTVYAGSLGAGVFKSTDGATTWSNVGLRDRNVFKLAIDPQHPQTVYAATSRGLSRSTNGGTSWRSLGQRAAYVHSMIVDPRDRRRVFVGTTAGAVYRSVDGGDTWDLAASGLPAFTIYALAIDQGTGTLYAAPEKHGVWRSADDGATWTQMPAGPADGVFVTAIKVAADHKLYVASLGSGVFTFANGAWTMASTGLASPQIADLEILGNGVVVAATYDAGIFRSADGAATWTWGSSGLSTSRINALAADPSSTARVYAATPDGVFRSADGGVSWQPLNTGMRGINTRSVTVDPAAPLRVYAATNGLGVFLSSDGGATWTASTAGLGNFDARTVAIGPATGALYAALLGGGVARSTDAGKTWTGGVTLDLVDSFVLAVVVNPINPSIVYAGTAGRGVLKSTNGGVDWQPVSNGLGSMFLLSLAIDRQHPDTLYAGTADSGVFYTTNGGATWAPLNDGLFNPVVTSLAVSAADSTRVWAGTEGGGVFSNHVSLPATSCSFTLSTTQQSLASASSTFSVSVTTGAACPWRIDSGSEWLTAGGSQTRTGSGTVTVTAAINIDNDARSGVINIAGKPVVVVQKGVATLFRLTITRAGTGSGTVTSDWVGIQCGTDCVQMFTDRLPVALTATPSQGSVFVGWEGDADCVDGALIMAADRTCTARFDTNGDFDGDGLPDLWEVKFGLDPASAVGVNGASGDPDGDGRTNLQEYQAGTHPRGFVTRYFATGAQSSSSSTLVDLFNGQSTAAHLLVHFIPSSGSEVVEYRLIPTLGRATVDTSQLTGLAPGFAISVESDVEVVAERTLIKSNPAATAADPAVAASTRWFQAGGSTRSGRRLEYTLFNPGTTSATVDITHLPSAGSAITTHYTVPARGRVVVNVLTDGVAAGQDVAGVVSSNVPVVVDATEVSGTGDALLGSLAAPSAGYLQYLAAEATGPLVGGTIDLLNPSGSAVTVTLTYVLASGGIVQRPHTIAAYGLLSLNPATDDSLIADTTFGVIANASAPFVMTGSSWWPGSSADWYEGGGTTAASVAGKRWALAGGEIGGPTNSETEIAVANVTSRAGSVRVRVTFDDGTSVARQVDIAAVSRITISVGTMFPEAANRRFSAMVESLGVGTATAPDLVVEHASYTSPGGVPRAGGTRLLATPLP